MEDQARQLEERCTRAEKGRAEVVRDRTGIEDELERLRVEVEDAQHNRGQLKQERNALVEVLTSEQEALTALSEEHKRLAVRLQEAEKEHRIALDNVQRLERVISARNEVLAQTEEWVRTQACEADHLRSSTHELERIKTQRDDALQAPHLRARLEEVERVRAAEGGELVSLREKTKQLGDETTKLQRRLNELMMESADKEVRIVQLNKARAQDFEDKDGLNAALQAKQQELELIKRKLGVKGTAGVTPTPSRMQRASYSRRESTASSNAFETPLPRALIRKESAEQIPPSESTASVLSSSISSNPLQTSSRVNIYGATPEQPMTSTPGTVKPVRRMPDQVPPRSSMRIPSHSRLSSLSVSSIRGVHFAPSESTESETDASDVTVKL